MIDRRTFLATAALAAVAAPRLGEARPTDAPRVPRVGVLGETNPLTWMVTTPVVDIECRWADVERASLPDLARQLVTGDVDAIVAVGSTAVRAAAGTTARVPIVAVADDDEAAGVKTLARSAANVAFLGAPSESRMARQRLRLLAALVPGRERVAVLFNPDTSVNTRAVARLPADVLALPARSIRDVEHAVPAAFSGAVGGLVVLADTLFAIHAARLVELARDAGVPAVYGARTFVNAGGLMALYGDMGDTIRRTAALVRELLAGVRPAALVPPPAPRPQIVLNLATAGRLGVDIPPSLLAQALVTTA